MKKKITLILLVLVCALCCALGLTACGSKGGDGGNGGGKTVTGLVIVDSNGNEYYSYDMGSIAYGNTPDWSSLQLYVKYSDNTKALLDNDSNVSVSYYYNGNEIASLDTYEVGEYRIEYRYNENTMVSVSYTITTSATASPYVLSLSASSWKYPERPTVTVKMGDTEINGYSVYCITAAKYNEIKNAADFKAKLEANCEWYDSNSTKPGNYYLFAETSGYNTNFVMVTVQKGDVTPTNTDNFNGYYSYGSQVVGKINLSEVSINTRYTIDKPITVEWKNSKDETVYGSLQWLNPDEKVDSTNNGMSRKVKWVPSETDADYYNEYVVPDPIPLTIEKGYVNILDLDYEGLGGFSSKTWDGSDSVIKLSYSSDYDLESFKAYVKVTYNGNEIDLGTDGLLGTENEIGVYTYNLELRDKVNYYWSSNETDVEDKSLVFTISPIMSSINIYPQTEYYMIDENRQVKIQIKPGTETGGSCNATPYVAGTLQANVLAQYTMDPSNPEGSTETSRIEGTAEVVNEDGYDWVVITITDFKKEPIYGLILIELKATGKDHYDDINYVATSLHIGKYNGTITCPITAGMTMEEPIGTKVSEMYDGYPGLKTELGTWVLYIKYTSNSDWSEPSMDLQLPSGEYSFKAVYESGFVQYAGEIDEVEFTVKGV